MSNTFIKIISPLIIVFVVIINAFGNFIGVGDIIHTGVHIASPELTAVTLSESELADAVDFYNNAVTKTSSNAPKGKCTTELKEDITADGSLGEILDSVNPIIKNALKNNTVKTDFIPGNGNLKPSDIESASMKSVKGQTQIYLKLKDQIEDSEGPVTRGIGISTDYDAVLDNMGASIKSGKETIKFSLTNAYIICFVDNDTGRITEGKWYCDFRIFIGDAEFTFSDLTSNIQNLNAVLSYDITI